AITIGAVVGRVSACWPYAHTSANGRRRIRRYLDRLNINCKIAVGQFIYSVMYGNRKTYRAGDKSFIDGSGAAGIPPNPPSEFCNPRSARMLRIWARPKYLSES